ncbi:MAG: hypothetical protein U1F54_18615 [Burkholderiales bacterium]
MSLVQRLLAIVVFSLALVRPASAVDYTDIWYIPAESGWGVNFIQSNNFIFATFFIYGQGNAPFWVSAQLTKQNDGTWKGPVYQTTGTNFSQPWNADNNSVTEVGSATFTPTSAITGTLVYSIGTATVTKSIQRQALTPIPVGGSYRGAYRSVFSNCNDSALNGPVVYDSKWTVTQTTGGTMTFQVTSNDPFTMTGPYYQTGTLFSIPAATYTFAGKTMTANVTQIKATAQGLEGVWRANVGAAYPGCVEEGTFSLLYLPN